MDFWAVFNWLWGGTDIHAVMWPWDYPLMYGLVFLIGFVEFILYLLALRWMTKNYGSPHAFWHFVVIPAFKNVQYDSDEGQKLLEVQERYYTRYVEQQRAKDTIQE